MRICRGDLNARPPTCRFGSVRLRSPEQLQQLVEQGFHYGQRLQQAGVWAAWLGAAAGQAQQGFKAGAAAVG